MDRREALEARVICTLHHFVAAAAAVLLLAGPAAAQTPEGRCGVPTTLAGPADHAATPARQPDGRLAATEAGGWDPLPQLGWNDRRGGGKLAIAFNATATAFRGFGQAGAAEPKARRHSQGCASL